MKWSLQQEAIFKWFENPSTNLVVRARAGTGKTTTIIEAIKRIPKSRPMPLILVCAFNKRIQEELKKRVVGTTAEAQTLHALGLSFIKQAWGKVIVDNSVEDERIQNAIAISAEEWEVDPKYTPGPVLGSVKRLVSLAKGSNPYLDREALEDLCVDFDLEPDDYRYSVEWSAAIAHLVLEETKKLDPLHRISFDDMLYLPVVKDYLFPVYDWVVVDEAQDMNYIQLLLAERVCTQEGHIVVVGDEKQAIYGFRGADSDALDRLKAELKADELGLNTTYRCPKSVVRETNKIVIDFFAGEENPEGLVRGLHPEDFLEEVRPGDVILSRTNAPLVPLCLSLIRSRISAKVEGRDIGKALKDRAIKLRATSIEDFLKKLTEWAAATEKRARARGKNVDAKLQTIYDTEHTLEALTEGCETIQEVLSRCDTLFADLGAVSNAVVLSTIHKAKGLEWDNVFVLKDTLYVYGKKPDSREEKNIHYVGITRAKTSLTLVTKEEISRSEQEVLRA